MCLGLSSAKYVKQFGCKNPLLGDWRDGSAVESTSCSFRALWFGSHKRAHNNLTQIPGDPVPTLIFSDTAHIEWTEDVHADKTLVHLKKGEKLNLSVVYFMKSKNQ